MNFVNEIGKEDIDKEKGVIVEAMMMSLMRLHSFGDVIFLSTVPSDAKNINNELC